MEKIVAYITFYGWADNDPPGKEIAYPHRRYSQALHDEAGGVGTYEDPITFAAARGQWPVGTKMYVPIFEKYFILEDICASCSTNHDQIDIWMESDNSHEDELIRCENKWTKRQVEVEVNPEPDRPIDLEPFFNPQTGVCR
jgi:3D (Asp-Asp-Asp) domain-containing protein